MLEVVLRTTAQPIITLPSMTSEEKKMLGRFLRLPPTRISCNLG